MPSPVGVLGGIARRRTLSLVGVLAGLGFAGLSSGAAVSAQAATACPNYPLSQPFTKWGDSNFYTLVAGGNFEGSLAGWTLSGGAQRASGSETYAATGALGASSLALPTGAAAQSPFTCVGPNDRTFRLFARGEGLGATVQAQIVYQTPLGNIALPVGKVVARSSWEPSSIFHTGAALANAITLNGTVQVALRFSSLSGSARIDDVFLDPRMR